MADQEQNGPHILVKLALGMTIGVVLFMTVMGMAAYERPDLPPVEGHNAEQAYEWYAETHDTGAWGHLEHPTCSLMAREWIDKYRAHHNLTREEYPCAVWYNDMQDWFYY